MISLWPKYLTGLSMSTRVVAQVVLQNAITDGLRNLDGVALTRIRRHQRLPLLPQQPQMVACRKRSAGMCRLISSTCLPDCASTTTIRLPVATATCFPSGEYSTDETRPPNITTFRGYWLRRGERGIDALGPVAFCWGFCSSDSVASSTSTTGGGRWLAS